MIKFVLGVLVGILLTLAVAKAVHLYDVIEWRLDRIENFLTESATRS